MPLSIFYEIDQELVHLVFIIHRKAHPDPLSGMGLQMSDHHRLVAVVNVHQTPLPSGH